jgi:hypothetical protein
VAENDSGYIQWLEMIQDISSGWNWFRIYPVAGIDSGYIQWMEMIQDSGYIQWLELIQDTSSG